MPPVPPTVMLYNPPNARQIGANSTHVKAPFTQFANGSSVPIRQTQFESFHANNEHQMSKWDKQDVHPSDLGM